MFWVLAVAAVVGWMALGRPATATPSGRAAGGSSCRSAAVLVTTVLFYGAHRIRAPAEPVLVVLAAVGILVLWDRSRR